MRHTPEPLVVDASVAVKWVLTEKDSGTARALIRRRVPMSAPELLSAETTNVLWKRVRAGEINLEQAYLCWDALRRVPVSLHRVAPLTHRALEYAVVADRSVYDCLYLALAEQLGTPLLTADEGFRNAVAAVPAAPPVLLLAESVWLLEPPALDQPGA